MLYIYLGRKIKVNILLPLLLFLRFYSGVSVLPAAVAVIIHEAGHFLTGAALGLKAEAVTLSPLGADIRYAGIIPYKTDVLTALAGPLSSVIFALAARFISHEYFAVSLIYGLLNLLPVPCFDGDRMARGVVYGRLPYDKADTVCCVINTVFLILLYLFSVFLLFYTSFNASLLLICAYIFVKSYMQMGK